LSAETHVAGIGLSLAIFYCKNINSELKTASDFFSQLPLNALSRDLHRS